MEKPLVILASARKQGETKIFLDKVFACTDYKLIDLLDFEVSPYNYAGNYPTSDEFLKVVDELVSHRVIVFATPVYWYATSGIMKTFFDRLTDVVTYEKQLGRQLKGKSTLLLVVGADEELPSGFEVPFKLTSGYLQMNYLDAIYYSTECPMSEEKLRETTRCFINKIKEAE